MVIYGFIPDQIKSNQIKPNQTKSNQIKTKAKLKQNQIKTKAAQEMINLIKKQKNKKMKEKRGILT
ncbi:MAG: hypothetical protein WAV55_10935 [Clostridiaceae bacterium]